MIFKACAFALIGAFVAVLLRELGFRGVGAYSALCGILVFSLAADGMAMLADEVKSLAGAAELSEIGKSALKIIGVGYIFGICSDICQDLGERAVASALNIVGKIEIFLIVLPYFKKILDYGIRLL